MPPPRLNLAFFGSSLISAYWNGAATYYRGLLQALNDLGHAIVFYEPDAYDRRANRDIPDPEYARSVIYAADEKSVLQAVEAARHADVIVKASGVGVFDDLLAQAVLDLKKPHNLVVYWDVDAPATLDRLGSVPDDPLRPLLPDYDLVLTYGGGEPVVKAYEALGARKCRPIYNGLDPRTHHPVPPKPRFEGLLGFIGNRMPDREARVCEFFFKPASALSCHRFLLGGSGWGENVPALPNVVYLGHVFTCDHNAFNCSPRAVLNISRESMARYGFSPATRVFEAAGAGACLITDAWEGIEKFLEPGEECLVAESGEAVVDILSDLRPEMAREIGQRARQRVLAEHTYRQRAAATEALLLEALNAGAQ